MFMQDTKAFLPAQKIALALSGVTLAPEFSGSGMLASSLVETPQGWRQAGSLMQGSLVQTYDGGLCPVARVERQHFWPGAGVELVHVPGGALDTCSDLWLMPEQEVIVASDIVEEVLEVGAAIVPARILAGFRGISMRAVSQPVEMVSLSFAHHEAVYVNSGALVHCGALRPHDAPDFFPRLDGEAARAMLALVADGVIRCDQLARAA
jgi:hypothetical protein